jgi:hypothetical protein
VFLLSIMICGKVVTISLFSSSLRYHNLHPDYIHGRMKDLGKTFDLRILLVQVDVVGSRTVSRSPSCRKTGDSIKDFPHMSKFFHWAIYCLTTKNVLL